MSDPQAAPTGGGTPREASTTELRFYGASDDLCEIIGNVKGADEYDNCAQREGIHAFAFIVRRSEDEGLRVNALYDGSWSFAVGLLMDESTPLPDWPIRIEQARPDECSYSMALTITVPADVEVVRDSLRY